MTHPVSAVPSASRDRVVAARHLARWLGLAATPTFAIMAVLTAVLGGGPADMLCAAGHGSLLGGMVPMYLLMSAFHSAAWLRLISGGPIGAVSHRARLVLRDARKSALLRMRLNYYPAAARSDPHPEEPAAGGRLEG
jgi:hypothetical protein